MKVLVVGANGKVARHFAEIVKDHESIQEKAMIRKAEQESFFSERGIETVLLDLAKNSIDELAEAARGMDAVIFSAGAGGKGLDKTVKIDLDGAIKAMTAAEHAGVKRFVMVSTFRTGREEMEKENSLQVYTIAKNYADEWLKNRTELDWTIVHPGILVDESGTGKIKVGTDFEINEIPREDVARTLVAVLENDNTIKKEFEVLAGDKAVNDAVKSL
ncbi:SDR family oxidoreductase [Aerococcaceae bacterium INB8]|uniref:SDR family oxidoreductase n=1 Tax=Ruoffia halotolerans TaxID=2748684 RepID=A0A839A2W6_9LACT|nr:SDR family oxidoreductase [Ruoffia halotolerans]MBA5728489.1 SDR family oxidoreductase [Ruoffia halotolerans]